MATTDTDRVTHLSERCRNELHDECEQQDRDRFLADVDMPPPCACWCHWGQPPPDGS